MRVAVRAWLAVASLLAALSAHAAAPLVIEAPEPVRELLDTHVRALREAAPTDERTRRALVRRARREITALLATEGYFTPTVTREAAADGPLRLKVEPGSRATIGGVDLRFEGAIAEAVHAERREALVRAWALPAGRPFTQAAWDGAKAQLLDATSARDFAAARLARTRAAVDPAAARVDLEVVVDSGPPYTLGELEVRGLEEFAPDLVTRYNAIDPGDPYDRDRLLELQRVLQGTPYFASVVVEAQAEADGPRQLPVRVLVAEAKPRRIEFGTGYSSNNGYRMEAAYRDANLLDRGWLLSTGLRLEQRHRLAYADVFLPPERGGRQDSFGTQIERSDTQGLRLTNGAVGIARRHTRGDIETHLALRLQRETYAPDGLEPEHRKALTLNWTWTWRRVDDLFDPREGFVLSAQLGGGAKAAFSDQNFLRASGRIVRYQPVGKRDGLILRAEGGVTVAESRDGIPQDFLFRTGGAQSVRGYAYQSLGVEEGDAIVGGRYMATLSAEYVHWWNEKWGTAAFIDAGNAADERPTFRLLPGYGLGARWKSPAGPLALDLAYGQEDRRLRLHFAVAIAF